MTRIVFVTQLLDPDDPVLGFVSRQLEVLHERVPDLVVIANEVRRIPDGLTGRDALTRQGAWGRPCLASARVPAARR